MTNVGERTEAKPGARMLNVGLVVLLCGGVLAVLNAMNEGRPPGWALLIVAIGLVTTIAGYAMRILAAVERR